MSISNLHICIIIPSSNSNNFIRKSELTFMEYIILSVMYVYSYVLGIACVRPGRKVVAFYSWLCMLASIPCYESSFDHVFPCDQVFILISCP